MPLTFSKSAGFFSGALPWVADLGITASGADQMRRADNAADAGNMGAANLHGAAGNFLAETGVGSAGREITTWGLGAPLRAAIAKTPTRLGFSAARTAPPINPLWGTASRSLKFWGRGLGAGAATAGANLLDRGVGGYGGPQYEPGTGGWLEDVTHGLRSSVAGAVGGTPLGPWGAITGAITNPIGELSSMRSEIGDINQNTASQQEIMKPEWISNQRAIAGGRIANGSAMKTLALGTAGVIGSVAIAKMLSNLRSQKKERQALRDSPGAPMVPKLAESAMVDASNPLAHGDDLVSMKGFGPWVSDYVLGAWNAERAGRARALTEASGKEAPFNVRNPITADTVSGLTGAVLGGGLGYAAGSGAGSTPLSQWVGTTLGTVGGGALGTLLARYRRRGQMQQAVKDFDETDPATRRLPVSRPSTLSSWLLPMGGYANKGYGDTIHYLNGGEHPSTGHLGNAIESVPMSLPIVGEALPFASGLIRNLSADHKINAILDRAKVGKWTWQQDSLIEGAPPKPISSVSPVPMPVQPQPQPAAAQAAAAPEHQSAAGPGAGPGVAAPPAPAMGVPPIQPTPTMGLPAIQQLKPVTPVTAPAGGVTQPMGQPSPALMPSVAQPAGAPASPAGATQIPATKRARLSAWIL